MRCDECQRRPATVFLTQIVNGHKTNRELCGSCGESVLADLEQRVARSRVAGATPLPDDAVFERLASSDQRFTADAFRFVTRAIIEAFAAPSAISGSHVSGREIAEAFRLCALREFGAAALSTLRSWGIGTTDDIGTIIFLMVEAGVVGVRPEDSPEDFHSVYEFASAFPTVA